MRPYFSSFRGHTRAPAISGGPLGLKEMSVCSPIHSPVPVVMTASTCCFNVTAGSASILHWLWLPSAAGSSPLYPPPAISSAISASPHLPFLVSYFSYVNITSAHTSLYFFFHALMAQVLHHVTSSPRFFCLSLSIISGLCNTLLHLFSSGFLLLHPLLLFGKWPQKQQGLWQIGS